MNIDTDIYPCTIIADRYDGSFSGAPWTAWRLSAWEIPDEVEAGDEECHDWWAKQDKSLIGLGQSPQEAYDDLKQKIQAYIDKENESESKKFEENLCKPFIENGYELMPDHKTFYITDKTQRFQMEIERRMVLLGYVFFVVFHDEFGDTMLIPSQAHYPD